MRVNEFLNLKLNCLEIKDNGTYWITLPRQKKKADSPFRIEVTNTIQINREMYSLIMEYVQFIKDSGIKTEYLLPYDLYVNYLPFPKKSTRQRKGTKNRMKDKYLQRIIDDFYLECVKDNSLEQVSCGDTRHFAIMNMFLQGFNMLSIARMAGHDDLDTQFNYFSHMDHYIESKVYMLSQKKFAQRTELNVGNRMTNNSRYIYDKSLIHNDGDLPKHLHVEYGYCLNENFPENCGGECRTCSPYYLFKPAINEFEKGLKWLTDRSEAIKRNIKEVTDMMFAVNMNMYYDLANLEPQQTGQAKLQSVSAQLVRLMDQKATVDASIRRYKHE